MPKILYFFIIFFAFFAYGCQEATPPLTTTETPVDSSATPEFKNRMFLSVSAQNLRIRRTPDLEGEVAITLPLNTIVEYLHDSTKFTTPITYNGQKYNSHWYKIRTANNVQGWIYGGLANFLTETENRRIIALEKSNEGNGASSKANTKKSPPQQPEQATLDRYTAQLNKLSSTNPKSVSTAISLYQKTFSTSNDLTKDLGFQQFRSFHSLVLKRLQQAQSFDKYNHLKKDIEIYGRANMSADDFTSTLGENGFNFGFNKNTATVYLKKDLDFVARHFYKEVSSAMREYIDQEQLEDETAWVENKKLLITPEQLAQWVVFWDNFLVKHPNFTLKNKIIQHFSEGLDLLLAGSEQSPAFADRQILTSDFKSAYQWILEKQGNSRLGVFFSDYYQILVQQNFKLTAVTEKAQQKFKSALLPT